MFASRGVFVRTIDNRRSAIEVKEAYIKFMSGDMTYQGCSLAGEPRHLQVIDQPDDIFHRPQPIRHASGHRGSDAKRLMDADEVVEHEVERQRVVVVFELLRERVGEPGEAAKDHAD